MPTAIHRPSLITTSLLVLLALGGCSSDASNSTVGSDAGDVADTATADTGGADTRGADTANGGDTAPDAPDHQLGEAWVVEAEAVAVTAAAEGRAHDIEGLVRAEQAHTVRVVFRPDDGGEPVSSEPIALEAGVDEPFALTVETLTDEGDRRFDVEVVHVAEDVVLGRTAFVAAAPLADDAAVTLDAVVQHNYYTDEAEAQAVFRVRGTRLRADFTAEVTVDLPDPADDLVATAPVSESTRNLVAVPLGDVPEGEFPVELRLLDDDQVLGEAADTLVRRPAPSAGRITQIDRDRRVLVVDGEPLLPIGVVGIPTQELDEAAGAGFNLTVRWTGAATMNSFDPDAPDAEQAQVVNPYLDAIEAAGMYAFEAPVKLSEYYFEYEDPNFDVEAPKFNQQVLPHIIRHAKEHPAVIAYYSYDEPLIDVQAGVDQQAGTTEFAQITRQHDPYHPVYVLFSIAVPDWPGAYDFVGRDFYPSADTPLSDVHRWTLQSFERAHAWRMPYIHMPLFETSDGRPQALTPAMVRAQAYLATTAGAKGLMWWMWPAAYHDNWQAYMALAEELSALETALLAEPPAQTVRYTQPDTEDTVKALIKNHEGTAYLIAVNSLERPVDVDFGLPSRYRGEATVRFDGRTAAIDAGALTDQIEPYGRRVYELDGAWPDGAVLTVDVTPGEAPPVDPGPTLGDSKNFVPNASIERDFPALPDWPYGWYPANSIAESGFIGAPDSRWMVDTAEAWEGSRSLRLVKETPGVATSTEMHELWGAPAAEAKLALPAGDYVASVYLKADEADTSAWVFAGWGDTEIVDIGTDWQRVEVPFTLDDATDWHFMRVYLREQGTLWIDGAQVEAGATATEWVHGPDGQP